MSEAQSASENPAETPQDGGRPGAGGQRHSSGLLRWAHSKHDRRSHIEDTDPERQPLLDEEAEPEEGDESPQATTLTKKEKAKLFFASIGAQIKQYAKYLGGGLAFIVIILAIGFIAGYFWKKGKQSSSSCTSAACVYVASEILATLPLDPLKTAPCSDFYGYVCPDGYGLPLSIERLGLMSREFDAKPAFCHLRDNPLNLTHPEIEAVFRQVFDQGLDETKQATKISDEIKASFIRHVEEAKWISPNIRAHAIAELHLNPLQQGHTPHRNKENDTLATTFKMKPPGFSKNFPQYLNYGSYGFAVAQKLLEGKPRQSPLFRVFTLKLPLLYLAVVATTDFLEASSKFSILDSFPPTIPSAMQNNACPTSAEHDIDMKALYATFDAWRGARKTLDIGLPGLEHYSKDQLFFIVFGRGFCGLEVGRKRLTVSGYQCDRRHHSVCGSPD